MALAALGQLPPPRRGASTAAREGLLRTVTAQLQRPASGGIVAACLEARGCVILSETADALCRAKPLQRPRELRRLNAPAFLALCDALDAAAAAASAAPADAPPGGAAPLVDAAARLQHCLLYTSPSPRDS